MEQNSADLLTDAFSDTSLPSFPEGELDTSLPSFPEGELDFESLHFDEAMPDMSPGTLPVLREEEEDVGQEEEEPGGETGNVSDHISVETYDVRVTEEDTHHTDEEEMGSGEETQHIDEEEMGSGEETQHIDELEIRSGEEETQHIDEEEMGSGEEETQHIDEEEIGSGEEETQHIDEEEAEIMDSGEEENTGIKNLGSPGGWSVVVHYDEESWDGALQDIEKIVTTGQPFAEQESENRKVRNVEQGAYENSDVRCFEGVTEDGTMEITAGICEEGERHTAEKNQEESSDSDLEILTGSVTKQRRKEVNKVVNSQQTFPQEKEEEEERDEDGAPEVVSDCPDPAASVADLHLSETISDVPTSTLHGEAGRGRAAVTISRGTGNMSSSDSEESFPGALWTSEAEQREDKRETWLWGEAGPGTSEEENLCEVQPELAGRLKSRIHADISWDTGGNNVDSGGLIQDYQYEASGITESGELAGEDDDEEDDEEENRSWEQEKERIKAFHKFYYDEEEEDGENTGRKSRVQFCMDPLPQVIEYTDSSSDVDLVDSSSDGDEDLDSTARLEEQREPERQRMSFPETQESQEPQGELQDLSKMPRTHRKRDRCLRVLKFLVKMTLLTAIGLLAFWWTRDQLDLDW